MFEPPSPTPSNAVASETAERPDAEPTVASCRRRVVNRLRDPRYAACCRLCRCVSVYHFSCRYLFSFQLAIPSLLAVHCCTAVYLLWDICCVVMLPIIDGLLFIVIIVVIILLDQALLFVHTRIARNTNTTRNGKHRRAAAKPAACAKPLCCQ